MPSDVGRAPRPPLIVVSAAVISYVHTVLGFFAFGSALVIALGLHYKKVVRNGIAGWPDEFWPSVSATIGDWYPERNFFQVGIALMSGPRFLLVLLSSLLVALSHPSSARAKILPAVGIARTLACGGWVYVTSTDDHDFHDIAMIAYIALTPPWMYISSGSLVSSGGIAPDSTAVRARTMRRRAALAFWGVTPFMIFFFYRHKVLEIPGAYTLYSFFEWSLIAFDLLFDFASVYDLSRLEIHVVEASRPVAAGESLRQKRLLGGSWVEGGAEGARRSGAWTTTSRAGVVDDLGLEKDGLRGTSSAAINEGLHRSTSRDALLFVAEVYYAYCAWSTLTALHPTIFFFSVYNMGVGGHEALLVVQVLGLALVSLPPLRRILYASTARSTVRDVLRVVSLLGMACWWDKNALHRLLCTAIGNAAFAIIQALEWAHASRAGGGSIDAKVAAWLVGLLVASLTKYANHTNNPVWPFLNWSNGGHNQAGLVLALVSIVLIKVLGAAQPGDSLLTRPPVRSTKSGGPKGPSFALCALSVGALIFALVTFLADSGTMIAWTWTGYPVKGPMAIPHGFLVLAASVIGVGASTMAPSLGEAPWLFALLALSNAVLCRFENWTGFVGAVGIAASLPPLALPLVRTAFRHHDAFGMALAVWLVADLLTFFQASSEGAPVLTVAYAFVPGGKPFRERTWIMQVVSLSLLAGGVVAAKAIPSLSLPSKQGARLQRLQRMCLPILAGVAAAATIVPFFRTVPSSAIKPNLPQHRFMTAAIWTVHFGLDQVMYDSTRRIANLIRDMDIDVIGLLESDLHRSVFGNRDLTQFIAEEMGMYADLGPGPDKHTWGAALLSKFPIIKSSHHLLPSPHGELAPAIFAQLDVYGTPVHVMVSHNGQEEDAEDRFLQTTELARLLNSTYPDPVVFLGYVVTKPHAKRPDPYEILFEDGRIHDIDPSDDDRWCQYIGFRSLHRIAYGRISRWNITDTELQAGRFQIPEAHEAPLDPDRDSRPREVGRDDVEAHVRLNEKFIDKDALVYATHMYFPYPKEPRYYAPAA